MAAEPLTLEELIDRATDINNRGSNDEASQSVANQVNREIGGPNTAVKSLIQRLQLHQEVITLQALTVVEACVKNCGVKFHNEIGKYKFINELIKLLSPKYDGDITPPAVKERVIGLLFNWYCGLPEEKKIAEAYRMLKQQGIIRHDPVNASRQNPPSYSEERSTIEDEDSSQLLATLLASTDPEDLHSANKLIKSMVKQEEQRLDRVSKRVQDLETVSNNVKLLDDMLMKFVSTSTGHEDLEIMHDLYESCLKLRPELFRLASRSAEDKDDSMAEILCASDELTRVIDTYKEKILLQKLESSASKPYNVPDTSANSSSLLDLGFDGPLATGMSDSSATTNGQASAASGNSLLDEQFKLLGLDVPGPTTQPPIHNVGLVNQLSQNTWQQQQAMQANYARPPAMMGATPQPMFQQAVPPMQTSQQLIGAMRPMAPMSATPQPAAAPAPAKAAPKKKNDLLDFDVFSEFHSPTLMTSTTTTTQPTVPKSPPADKVDGANQSALNHMLDISNEPTFNSNDSFLSPSAFGATTAVPNKGPVKSTAPPLSSNPMNSLFDTSTPVPTIPPVATQSAPPKPQTQQPLHAPLPTVTSAAANPQETYAVPLEALTPADYPPTLVYDKNGLKTLLHIAKDTRDTANASVIAAILSTISTSTSSVADFSIQVAVPKVMRVKLQSATSTELKAYNPIFPPPSISQVMLIANPTKENVRMRFKITYQQNGIPFSESTSVDQLPVT